MNTINVLTLSENRILNFVIKKLNQENLIVKRVFINSFLGKLSNFMTIVNDIIWKYII